jgi:processive 1,2-diacylglycerol beta-glucosyltransferase
LYHAITAFQPDAIVCTHFLPAELCAGWRESNHINVPVYTVVTDFEPHRMWQHRGLDGYFVATGEAADRLINDGIDRSIIQVTGIPIQTEFASVRDRVTAKTRLAIDPDRSLLLLMGGGLGVGGIDLLARSLVLRPIDSQVAFITGHNRTLRRRLRQQAPHWIVRGFVGNMPDWLAAADVVISKAGGLAASELMAAGVPTIIPPSLRGHETSNAEYFTACGAAIKADSIPDAIDQAAALLQDRSRQQEMRSAAQRFARPNAAADVADYVVHGACSVEHPALRTTHHAIPS